ncbi:choice-of-anchor tandem repeat GloVer-containing protein [Corallibacter sp.]|uniref:choice-of-anchor tandem repeat GloVer-containing protein n=1 Tax=Corallibacter sp. TaxID=2038084 RepID=UPI003AB517B2
MRKLLLFILTLFVVNSTYSQVTELWGMTRSGGDNDFGTIFKTDENGNNHEVIYSFQNTDGAFPTGDLVYTSNGKFYGMCTAGGSNGNGVLFEYNLQTNTYTVRVNFDNATTGSTPYGGLTLADNGKLYGMTYDGGSNNYGVLFEFDTNNNTLVKKLDFDGTTNGSNPRGKLLKASNGKLYGVTLRGGLNNTGVLFEFDTTTEVYTKKRDFFSSARLPQGSLIEADNGKFYVVTSRYYDSSYGDYRGGHLLEYDLTTDTFISKEQFAGSANLKGGLIQATNGKIYVSVSSSSGPYRTYIFKYDLDLDNLSAVTISEGSHEISNLLLAPNNKIYAMTEQGGTNNLGVMFEYDSTNDTYIIKTNFTGVNGSLPHEYTKLTAATFPQTYVPDDNFEQRLIDLGYDDVLDDYVLTHNISGVTNLLIAARNISDLTGIEDFVALENLQCHYNNLTALDLSNNTSLVQLNCSNNSLSSLNTSTLTSLEHLTCFANNITSLDLSMNTSLRIFSCSSNNMSSLNLRNGNNTIIQGINTTNNPSLTCVQVDDEDYSTANWTLIDSHTVFSEDCSTLSVNDTNIDNGLVIYPNPVKEKLFIKGLNTSSTYNLYNITGQFLGSGNLSKSRNSINVQHLNKGIFMIEIINASTKSKQTFKVIKN